MKEKIETIFIILLVFLATNFTFVDLARAEVSGVFNFASTFGKVTNCVPKDKQPDSETGCGPFCGDNSKSEFEQCRQAYFLKRQVQILEFQQISENKLSELESKNKDLKELLEKQNAQIENLIQALNEQNQVNNALSASLKYAQFLNIGLFVLLITFISALLIIFIKKNLRK